MSAISNLIKRASNAEKRAEKQVTSATKAVRKEARKLAGANASGESSVRTNAPKQQRRPNTAPRNGGKKSRRVPNTAGFSTLNLRTGKDGSVCITNRETLAVMAGNSNWTVGYNQLVNPRNVLMFPWLSQIAKKFDQYRFKRLTFHFVTRMGSAVTGTGAIGATQFTMIYDADDPAPEGYQPMMNSEYSSERAIDQNHNYSMSRKDTLLQKYFIQHNAGEPDLESPGYVMFSTYGCPAVTSNIGSLSVTYEVELYLPRNDTISVLGTNSRSWYGTTVPYSAFTSDFTNGLHATNGDVCTMNSVATGITGWYFPQPGRYQMSYQIAVINNANASTVLTAATNPAGDTNTNFDDVSVGTTFTKYSGVRTFDVPPNTRLWNHTSPADVSSPSLSMTVTAGANPGNVYMVFSVISKGIYLAVGSAGSLTGERPCSTRKEDELAALVEQILLKKEARDQCSSSSSSSSYQLVEQEDLRYAASSCATTPAPRCTDTSNTSKTNSRK